MAKKKIKNCRLGKVGGEAVLEGVMMRSGDKYSIASRKDDGSITVSDHTFKSVRKKSKFFNIPIIRGVVALIESFKLSFKVLTLSAEAVGVDLDQPESKFEKWLFKTFGDKVFNIIMGIAGFLGVVLAVGLFMLLPSLVAKGIIGFIDFSGMSEWTMKFIMSLIEGLIRIFIFVCYIFAVSFMPDIKRTFQYHGAEHKTIACYEAGDELTPENAAKHTRFHARCGTSFIFVMLIISVLVFSLPFVPSGNLLHRYAIKIPLMPLICGLGFEFIQFSGKHDNFITRLLAAPGLLMQRITTKEPDEKQLEIAITALKASMPDEFDRAEVDAVIEASKPKVKAKEEEAPEAEAENDVQ